MQHDRTITRYDPMSDLAERHSTWTVRTTPLHGLGEVVDTRRHLILIDAARYGRPYAFAHAVAHLDLGHVTSCSGGAFTAQQESDAHWLASMRLDSEVGSERA